MRTISLFSLILVFALACSTGTRDTAGSGQTPEETQAQAPQLKWKGKSVDRQPYPELSYPEAARGDQVDDYHGTLVADPYRWLEDVDSEATLNWVDQQNKVTRAFLDAVPSRNTIKERLTELWNYERYGSPVKRGGRYFFTHNPGLDPQSKLYVQDGLNAERRLLLDPNTLSTDGTVALSDFYPNPQGTAVALTIATAGSDWNEVRVLDVESGEWLQDHLRWIKFSNVNWNPEGTGFYYSSYDKPDEKTKLEELNYFQKLHFHVLGNRQDEDTLVLEHKEQKTWGSDGSVSEDGRFLVVTVWAGSAENNLLWLKDLTTEGGDFQKVVNRWEATYLFLGNVGQKIFLYTTKDAPMGKVVSLDLTDPGAPAWQDLVPESKDNLANAMMAGDQLVLHYLKDASSTLATFDLQGRKIKDLPLEGFGSADEFRSRQGDQELFFRYTGFLSPMAIHRIDLADGTLAPFKSPVVDFAPQLLTAKQVFYPSKDGTQVPMFIVHRKDLQMDGNNPVYLYGYGGFNNSLTPYYSTTNQVWMEMGGIYAMANIRGGGEYGEAWHQAGVKAGRQNSFDDFIAAAEYLIREGYSSPEKMSIGGGSNGGTLVGACMHQRPDLFAAAVPAVGVMDMLRYHQFTIGWAWVSDFGSSENPEEFEFLYGYSPYHNLKEGVCYPATMVTTADHDDRVVPGHSFKFAAALQHAQGCDNPALIRIESRAGHGAGTPTAKLIDASADRLAFLARTLGLEYPHGGP